MTLKLGSSLSFPDEAMVQKTAILAMSGAGKSNAAVVMAEEMYRNHLPWVAIDPKGDWWGVRAGADGTKRGLPIPVLGGLHGDIPLEPTAGKLVAGLIAERRLTCVLDVSEFDRQAMFRFLADFAETLLRKNTLPLHVFAEEADDYLPQMARDKGQLPRCLGAWQRLIKRGRFRGIGTTLITQRSSAINKDALNMTDTLIVLRVTAPLDHKAIKPWITEHGLGAELIDSLPTLNDGEAWVWSPQKLKISKRAQFFRRKTYDSGATPFSLDKATETATLTPIDLDALKSEMAETIERDRERDPDVLIARVRQLERELASRPDVEPEVVVEHVQVPVVPPEIAMAVGEFMESVRLGVLEYAQTLKTTMEQYPLEPMATDEILTSVTAKAAAEHKPVLPPPPPRPPRVAHLATESVALGDGAPRRLLEVLAAYHPDGRTKRQLAAQTGISSKRSTLRNGLSTLSTRGLITVSGERVDITEAGLGVAGPVQPLPTGRELLEHYHQELGDGAPWRIFSYLVEVYPSQADSTALAEYLELDPSTSTIRNALSRLRTLGLVEKGRIVVPREIMEAIR